MNYSINMGRFVQDSYSHGSLKDLQLLINNHGNLLDNAISSYLNRTVAIDWKSPIESDEYAEYRDDDFLKVLNLDSRIQYPLIEFWPKRGPQWDALGVESKSVFIVEAKANIPEIVTPPTSAGVESKSKIIDSFSEVKEYLNINNTIDWAGTFYQYTNRIAHLYYLRVLNGIDAFLVNVYFINDKTVDGPNTKEEWLGALTIIKHYLGIPKRNKLDKYMLDVFIDVNDINK